MSNSTLDRLIICVDEAEFSEDGTLASRNASNIFRLNRLIATGSKTGRDAIQHVRYYRAAADTSQWRRINNRSAACVDKQIKQIVEEICRESQGHQVEVCLYGSGCGAYIVQVVASLLHSLGCPKSMNDFDKLYQKAVELRKAFQMDDSLNGKKLMAYLQRNCNDPPKIQFIGVFDTLKTDLEELEFEPSFVHSIRHFRHALAINDTQKMPYTLELPGDADSGGRSFIQAWFMGSHSDICGGFDHDGLSLYPLQWMILESIQAGVVFQPNDCSEILSITFPQLNGGLPMLDSSEKSQWRFKYTNGIEVSMFDLRSVHLDTRYGSSHTVRMSGKAFESQRKMFAAGKATLIGWSAKYPHGNIIHPSVFAILDRSPRYYDKGIFKLKRRELIEYQERCLDGQGETQPWLDGFSLQASGVQAFRILVCGKTGVGKSTLINKVFGVETTEESKSYAQGMHDINKAFESPDHPGILIHDSRGWQAGSDSELELIAKFLQNRASQKNPAEELHVIWFCVDADVSRIEEADRRTLQIISQHSSHVPVFVIGTKKDKIVAHRQMELLEQYMEITGDFKEAKRLAGLEANYAAEKQFMELQNQLFIMNNYKVDGCCCISKNDDTKIRQLLRESLDLITDDRVRLFCVAAQVVDVEQKIDQAITEVMRLGTYVMASALVPLPGSGMIATPTVSHLLCEQVIRCFGFPKVKPEVVEEIMLEVVLRNLKTYMKVSLSQFSLSLATTIMSGAVGLGIFSAPPAARMLFKCACDIILILERSFRYQGKYISVKQLEDAAVYYTTETTKTFSGKETLLQQHVHDEVDRLIPLKNYRVGFTFQKLRGGLQDIIYMNRYDMSVDNRSLTTNELDGKELVAELKAAHLSPRMAELDSKHLPAELEGKSMRDETDISELEGDSRLPDQIHPDFVSSPDAASPPPSSLRHALSDTPTTVASMGPTESRDLLKKTKTASFTGSLIKNTFGRLRSKK